MIQPNPQKTVFRNVARVLISACVIALLSPIGGYAQGNGKSMEQRLAELDGVTSVEKVWLLPFISKFDERYIVTFSQPLDWEHPEKGSFPQRVEVSLKKGSEIAAMDTEGTLCGEYRLTLSKNTARVLYTLSTGFSGNPGRRICQMMTSVTGNI